MRRSFASAMLAALALAVTLGVSADAQAPAAPPTLPDQGGGELQQMTVTGYVAPRVGDGTQPVHTINQDFIQRQGDQTVSDVIQRLPVARRFERQFVRPRIQFHSGADRWISPDAVSLSPKWIPPFCRSQQYPARRGRPNRNSQG